MHHIGFFLPLAFFKPISALCLPQKDTLKALRTPHIAYGA